MATHEPRAWDKSVVDRAHELPSMTIALLDLLVDADVTGALSFPFILTAVN